MASRYTTPTEQPSPSTQLATSRNSVAASIRSILTSPLFANTTRAFRVTLTIAVAWWVLMGVMIIFTANPVTLNEVQLIQAKWIVNATLIDSREGRFKVMHEWKQKAKITELVLDPKLFPNASDGSKWIIPLSRDEFGNYVVTRAFRNQTDPRDDRPVRDPPYVYPENDDSQAQLNQFMASHF